MHRDGIVESQPTSLYESHDDRGRGQHLGERREIEDRVVPRGWSSGLKSELTECVPPERLVGGSYFDDCRRKRLVGDRAIEHLTRRGECVRHGEPLSWTAGTRGLGGRKAFRRRHEHAIGRQEHGPRRLASVSNTVDNSTRQPCTPGLK